MIDHRKEASQEQSVLHQWAALSHVCTDAESQSRLSVLRTQMTRFSGKEAASSRAEIENAHFLMRAGFSVAFLEATGGRTADVQCYAGTHRFFVEITVIQSTHGLVRRDGSARINSRILAESGDDFFEQAFVKRLLARMAEKAKQLDRYCAPVLLAVSIPDVSGEQDNKPSLLPLDLQRIAGMVIGVLAEVPKFSAVLLTFWNAPAQELRNPIRIKQVHWVTRPSSEAYQPRIRLLATNPFAKYRLTTREIRMLQDAM